MIRLMTILLISFFTVPASPGQAKRPMTFDDLISLGRVSQPEVSPDGKSIAFVVTFHNKTENSTNSNIYLVSIEGGDVRQLTNASKSNGSPQWLRDGKSLAFVSNRDGESQIWVIPIQGGEERKISRISTGASGLTIAKRGNLAAFTSDVFPDCPDDDCNASRLAERTQSKVKAKIFDRLPYRIWNSWKDGLRSHVFVMSLDGGKPVDVTPGDYDTPPIDLGGRWDYDFSPDGKEIAFTRNTDANVATSTNNDLFVVPVSGGAARRITTNPANDSQPLYSPDGKYIAYRKMERPGFEADRRQLVLYDRTSGNHVNLTANLDYSVDDVLWSPDSRTLYFTADDKGNKSVFRISVGGKNVETLIDKGYNHSLRITPDGKAIVFIKESINMPAEIHRMDVKGRDIRRLTNVNGDRIKALEMNPLEDYWFEGEGGTKVHGWIVRPPGFDASKRYPSVFLVHGGPQGQWGDQFHYRWSAQMFASRGHVVIMVNPRGSTGYGQRFTDEISRDWGGKVYVDLMKGLDAALAKYPFIDGNRIAAAGASYGGYMMSWISGQTGRFTCIVNHDGVFNPKSMYGTTEELWFPEWEFGGTPYQNPDLYETWSPLNHASKFKTPTLVVHGQLDYRVDVSEGFQLFTALQRQGIESKMLYFPDEGHWVTKPANAELWHKTVLDWIEHYTQ